MLCLLFFFSGLFWVLSLTITVLNYYWFTNDSGCDVEIFLITFTLALGVIFTILSVTNLAENGCKPYIALLTSSIVNAYCTYLCWDGLTNNTNEHCNTWDNAQDTGIVIAVGIFVLLITLGYVSFRKKEENHQEYAPIRSAAEPIIAKEESGEEDVPYKEEETDGRKLLYFHLFMILASVYMSMLLTNWGAANIENNESKTYDK